MSNRRGLHRLIWSVVAALAIAVGLLWGASLFYDPPIERLLNDALGAASSGLYHVRVESASISLLGRSVSVSGLELYVVSDRLAEVSEQGHGPRLRPHVTIDEFRIEGVRLLPLIRQRALIADSIDVDAPAVDLALDLSASGRFGPAAVAVAAPPDDTKATPPLTFAEQVREALRGAPEIRIERMRLREARGTVRVVRAGDSAPAPSDRVGRLDLEIDGLRIHPGATADEINNLFSRAITLSVEDVNLASGLSAARIRVSTGEQTARMEGLRSNPQESPEEYLARSDVREPDRIEVTVDRVEATGFDPLGMLSREEISAEALEISGFEIGIVHDRHKPGSPPRHQPQPHDLVGALPLGIRIDRIEIAEGRVAYSERAPEGQQPGTLTFESIRGTITDIDTGVAASGTAQPQPAVAQLNTMLMGAAPVSLVIRLPLRDPAPTMQVEGRISSFDATSLNGILTPLLGMEVASGTVDEASIEVDYVPGRATGHLDINYHGAQLRMTDRDGGSQNVGEKVLSFLANQIAVHDANPARPGEVSRPGKIDVETDETWSFFKLLWVPIRDALLQVLKKI